MARETTPTEPSIGWSARGAQHDGVMKLLKIEPTLRNLQRDPRYGALLHKMKLLE
jgi:hypothetical protein